MIKPGDLILTKSARTVWLYVDLPHDDALTHNRIMVDMSGPCLVIAVTDHSSVIHESTLRRSNNSSLRWLYVLTSDGILGWSCLKNEHLIVWSVGLGWVS
jgi:hypothetical protein